MKISEVKTILRNIENVSFTLPNGAIIPAHFHVTEVGIVNKHFIDCGGVERRESVANFQLWEAGDYDHRLAPQKFASIIEMSERILNLQNLDIEVEYQGETIGKFDLDFNGSSFILLNKSTACLAQDACGIPIKASVTTNTCTPGGGCC